MPLYRVLIHGSDFRVPLDGEVREADFFATRWVSATGEEQIEAAAIDSISEELQALVEDGGDPQLFLEDAKQAESAPKGVAPGISWFEHDNEEAGYEALDGEREAFWPEG